MPGALTAAKHAERDAEDAEGLINETNGTTRHAGFPADREEFGGGRIQTTLGGNTRRNDHHWDATACGRFEAFTINVNDYDY